MTQFYVSQRREDATRLKRIMEEHMLPCLLISGGSSLWKLFLNLDSGSTEYQTQLSQAERVIEAYTYRRTTNQQSW